MKKNLIKLLAVIFGIILAIIIFTVARSILAYFAEQVSSPVLKPMIYLYPEETTEVSVAVDYDGALTTTYPEYNGGWNVTAHPDGTLIDSDGRKYYGLFWEGLGHTEYDTSKGFVIEGSKTREFLEESLEKLGLTDKEANEFIVFWLPQMENSKYNFISFQTDAYTESARLDINPAPDSVIRIFMAWKPLEEAFDIEPQELSAPERKGFTVVEWGGTVLE